MAVDTSQGNHCPRCGVWMGSVQGLCSGCQNHIQDENRLTRERIEKLQRESRPTSSSSSSTSNSSSSYSPSRRESYSGGSYSSGRRGLSFFGWIGLIGIVLFILYKCGVWSGFGGGAGKSTVPDEITKTSVVINADVNLRNGPSTDNDIIMALKKGASVGVVDKTPVNGWIKVSFEGKEGYINGRYANYK